MIAVWVLAGLLVLRTVLQLSEPHFESSPVSSADFFDEVPEAAPQRRFSWRNLRGSRAFFLQMLALALLLVAALSTQPRVAVGGAKGIGTWLVVDTSASMSTLQGKEERMRAAQQQVMEAIKQAQARSKGVPLCWRVSAFDLEWRDLLLGTPDPGTAEQEVRALEPRLLGTDLNVLRRLPERLADQSEAECAVTHVVVISDQPPPDWLGELKVQPVIWLGVGTAVDNIGLTKIEAMRDPLTGMTSQVIIEITAFGQVPDRATLTITVPDGQLEQRQANWRKTGIWQEELAVNLPGLYEFRLSPGEAYVYDDEATIEVSAGQPIRVDWRTGDRTMLDLLAGTGLWIEDSLKPDLSVIAWPVEVDSVPTLFVGSGYGPAPVAEQEVGQIDYFDESSPLLQDLNLDVAERLGIQGAVLPHEFQPVLRAVGPSGQVTTWLAQRETPLAAFVPGFPTLTDDNLGRFSTTAFFNAVRWLLQARPLPDLYTLTTPAQPEPEGTRLALHPDEGNTAQEPYPRGSWDDLQPALAAGKKQPLWPVLLALAVLAFLLDRFLGAWRGQAWR